MSGFKIGATVSTAIGTIFDKWKAFVSLNAKPLIGVVIFYLVVIYGQYLMMKPLLTVSIKDSEQLVYDPGSPYWAFGIGMVLYFLSLFLTAAAVMNWQSILLLGKPEPDQFYTKETMPEFMGKTIWWERYKKYILYGFLLVLCMVGFFSIIMIPSFVSAAIGNNLLGLFILFSFVLWVFSMPYFARLNIVLPMIAADIEDAGVKSAMRLTKGMGWRIFGTYVGCYVIIYIVMFVLLVVFSVFGFPTDLKGADFNSGWYISAALLSIPVSILILVILMSVHPLILMQLDSNFADRWAELCDTEQVKPDEKA